VARARRPTDGTRSAGCCAMTAEVVAAEVVDGDLYDFKELVDWIG
jgi:hypothetical protein